MVRLPLAALLLLASCSFSKFDYVPCDSDTTCRATFGWGYTCNADSSLCEEAEIPARCESSYPEDLLTNRAAYKDDIVLGAMLWRGNHPDSAADAFSDEIEMKAFELAIQQVDGASGLAGTEYGLIECSNEEASYFDDLSYDDATVAVGHSLSYDIGVPAILGPDFSSEADALYVDVAPNDTLVMSHSATSPSLTTIDGTTHTDADPGLFWRTCAPDSLQGAVIASDMAARGITTVSVIYGSDAYGEGLADVFNTAFTALGGTVDLNAFDLTDTNQLSETIVTVGESDAQEVLFIASDGALVESFLKGAATEAYIGKKNIFLTDAAYSDAHFNATYDVASDLFPEVRGTVPTVDQSSATYALFQTSFQSAYNEDPSTDGYTSQAYDAAWLVLYGTAWSSFRTDTIDGLGIAKGLRHISYASTSTYDVETKPGDWNTVQSAFQAGLSIDVTGASGALDYDATTGETSAPVDVWTVACTSDTNCAFTTVDVVEP